MSTPSPDPDSGPDRADPRPPRMPRASSARTGFRALFSAAWWRGLARRLTARLRGHPDDSWPGTAQADGPADLLDHDEPSDTFTLETPALGDAFNFIASFRCVWTVQGTASAGQRRRRSQEVQRRIARQRPILHERIEDTIRPIAREYPPYRAAAAEHAILAGIRECLASGDLQVNVRAKVDVCEAVRKDLQDVWRVRLAEDAKGDLKKVSVELIGELQEAWRVLLLRGLRGIGAVQEAKASWIAPYALALAQDPEESAGLYLRRMIDHRVKHAEALLTDLSDIVANPASLDAIEFAFESDSALRAVLSHLGVPVAPRGSAGSDHETAGGNHA